MAQLKGSKTEKNLKDAFAGESQANRRYLYFAKVADVDREGGEVARGPLRQDAEVRDLSAAACRFLRMRPVTPPPGCATGHVHRGDSGA
jgi:rubrerythrin